MSNFDKCRPFLRWAGGKQWLIKYLDGKLDLSSFVSYHEPFVGGGSILFHFQPQQAYISDINQKLVDTYLALRKNANAVVKALKEIEISAKEYYRIRQLEYDDIFQRAAQFIFLNQTSFNGIYRVNSKGQYNVPYGKRVNFHFDFENIIQAGLYLKSVKSIECCGFMGCIDYIKKGSLCFLDPPYTISHNENGFISYNQKLFTIEDLYRLSQLIDQIKLRGAYYILTNAAHDDVKRIFKKNGDFTYELARASLIGGKNAKREKYEECIFTNIKLF